MLWEEAQSSGVERRFLDTSRAKKFLNFEAEITLKEGLQKTKEWYMNYLPSPILHKSNDLPPSMQALR